MARPATAAVRLLTGEREPVRLATTANIALYGLQTIDGMATEVGDRVLVKNQADARTNGIYTASEGQWFRAADARTARTMQKGTTAFVQEGLTNGEITFRFNALAPVVDADPIDITGDGDALRRSDLLDEDDMASNTATKVPSQQSVKAFVVAQDAALSTSLRAYADAQTLGDRAMLRKYAVDMYLGTAVNIECFGDSTQHGHEAVPPYGVVTETAPQRLQYLLRDYTSNNSIVVTNSGIDSTRLTQMIDGTDGSGSTFAAKMAVSTAHVVICNHGINDCQNVTPTPPATYHDYLVQFVRICRANGKVPVLETPNPIFAVPTLGTLDKANRLNAYVQIMKDVAEEMQAVLVDVNAMVRSIVATGDYRVQDVVPDGVHPSLMAYQLIGNLLAMPFLHPQPGLSEANQFMTVGEGIANTTPANNVSAAEGTRGGLQTISVATAVPKSTKILVRVDEPGLDIYMAYPIWSGWITSVGVNFDKASVGNINQNFVNFGADIIQDHEICVARNVPIGLHWININAAVANSFGVSGIRSRRTRVKRTFTLGAGSAMDIYKDAPVRTFVFFSSAIGDTKLLDELPVSRFLTGELLDVNFDAIMTKGTAFVLHGLQTGPLTGSSTLNGRMGVGVGCDNTTGFVTVYQISGVGTYTTTAVNAVDFSLVKRAWRLRVPVGTQTLQVYADGSLLGTVALTGPFVGGLMGAQAAAASKTLTVENLRFINSN
ncbi:hypothetical protein B5V01_24885 [Mesorhizobium erdmanii]|uniref:SGNH hydrolase-type esterase domain-containing protein n=3 Tax=Phyllobacteriaceae TaxID=69277 RepID=A0A3M9XH31_9HYPH|nr:hypothetical protein DNR46_06015 [Mesorhizobium japonicum]RXT40432.1 hypothetical protein B5V01_24885 [Mesorhizobium erdmanii]